MMSRKLLLGFMCGLLLGGSAAQADEKPGIDLKLYGFLKLDGSFDQNPTSHGNFVMWVPQQTTGSNDQQFSMTANETRLGLDLKGKNYQNYAVSGKIEVDLFASLSGVTVAENKSMLQLRHAYFSLERAHWKLIAGQTWDIIAPLNPATLNYSVLWGGGNIGYRRPQISLWYSHPAGAGANFNFGAGVFRTIGSDLTPTLTLATGETSDGTDDGTDAAIPSVQGIVEFKRANDQGRVYRVGVSGLYGKLTAETNQGNSQDYSSWAVVGHAQFSPSPNAGILAEAFRGSNLSSYLGSILLSSRTSGLKSTGFWSSAWLNLSPVVKLSVGYSIEDPSDNDVASGRSKNSSVFGNVRYTVVPQATIALELSHWQTDYKGADTAKNLRAQTSFILNF